MPVISSFQLGFLSLFYYLMYTCRRSLLPDICNLHKASHRQVDILDLGGPLQYIWAGHHTDPLSLTGLCLLMTSPSLGGHLIILTITAGFLLGLITDHSICLDHLHRTMVGLWWEVVCMECLHHPWTGMALGWPWVLLLQPLWYVYNLDPWFWSFAKSQVWNFF